MDWKYTVIVILILFFVNEFKISEAKNDHDYSSKRHRRKYDDTVDVLHEDVKPEKKIENKVKKRQDNTRRHSRKIENNSFEDSGSIEIPIRRYPENEDYNYKPVQRPIYNLLLGVLDTCYMASKADLRRAQERERKSNKFLDGLQDIASLIIRTDN